MPGAPTSVRSCAVCSCRTRSTTSRKDRELVAHGRPAGPRASSATSTPKRERACTASQTAIGSAFPFAVTGSGVAVLDRSLGRPVGLLADEDPVHRRRRLQARRRVDDVARDHPLALERPRAERDERLAGVAPRSAPAARSSSRDPVPDRQRRPHRPLGIVLVRHRRAEDGHHRVADELLHRAAEALQLRCAAARSTATSIARTSSGSSASARDVKPTRSANSTVTTFRSSASAPHSAGAAAGAEPAPGSRPPQRLHVTTVRSYTVRAELLQACTG